MTKQVKRVYRLFAWTFAVVLASATFVGCRATKYGAPTPKYGPAQVSGYQNKNVKGNNVE